MSAAPENGKASRSASGAKWSGPEPSDKTVKKTKVLFSSLLFFFGKLEKLLRVRHPVLHAALLMPRIDPLAGKGGLAPRGDQA